ncbi:hypothetical protein BYT27DRAFT_7205692 [Phlegmacium glaucopus]|nr:hypothetical protein BYT27DRAFT_7205692 [Phlegmacium glaucopus]
MESVASSPSEPIAADNTADIDVLLPENNETLPSSSEAKVTNKKRRLEEDIPTAQGSSEAIAGPSTAYSVTPSSQSQSSHKKRRLDSEPSGLDSSDEVEDGVGHDAGDSSTSFIAPAAPATTTTVPSVSTQTLTQMAPPTPPATSVQVSTTAADPRAGSPFWDDFLADILASPPNKTSKRVRLDIEPTATNRNPTLSSTLGSTEPLTANADTNLHMDAFPKPSPLVVLPVELLSEILIYTGSPQHVLAVARTCKALCQTLLSTTNQFIWREARRACAFDFEGEPVYLPDPPEDFFGEAAYAAFVFDSGVCEACGKETNMMYSSFALMTRLCKNLQCHSSPITTFDLTEVQSSNLCAGAVAVLESNACLMKISYEYDLTFFSTTSVTNYCRTSDWRDAEAWIKNAPRDDAFRKKYERVNARKIRWMKFTVSLHKWKFARQAHYYNNRDFNNLQCSNLASEFGWDRTDMVNSTVYGLYQQQKNKVMEKVKEADVRVMMDKIESQLLALSERRTRHAAEVAYLKNRSDTERLYNSLRSSKAYPFLPSLPTFRQLPIISLLHSAPITEGITITQTLTSNSLMRSLLSDQLKQWAEAAKDDFAVLLGFPKKWKNANKNVLHPVERAMARFQCIRCGSKAKDRGKKTNDGCLDFAAACQHVCSVGGKAMKGKNGKWDVGNFVKDEKAIHALNKIIQALKYSEDKAGALAMIDLGLAVLCTSCDPHMMLDSRSVVGHCHRHDSMELSLALSVNTVTSYLGGYPFTFGLAEKLMGSEGLTLLGKKAIESKNYGCRHCLRAKQVELAAAAAAEDECSGEAGDRNLELLEAVQVKLSTTVSRMHDRGIEGPRNRPPALFNFNGMRSHLKAKHHIETIRDEDFFCYDTLDL